MKSTTKLSSALLITAVLLAVLGICTPVQARWRITQLTDNDSNDWQPHVSGSDVVWLGYDGNDFEVFLYDGSTTTQLSDNSYDDCWPQVSGSNVVWSGYDGNDYEVLLYDGSTTRRLTDNDSNDWQPQVAGSNVVWMGDDGNDYEIFLYDGSTVKQLTDNSDFEYGPQVSGSSVVWAGTFGTSYEIFLYDGSTTTRLTNNSYEDLSPQISGSNVVWWGYDGNDYEIFLYDGSTATRLTNNDYRDEPPQISGSNVVWQAYDGSDYEIFMAVLEPAATIYVDPYGLGDFTSIQAAIDDANNGDKIEVAPGTYNEAIDFLGKKVTLYSSGGPKVTTIDANGIAGACHVVQCVSGEDANTILEGFTITGGDANGPDPNDQYGGGMFNFNSSPTVNDCNFTGNWANSDGGGMYNNGSSPTVTSCIFTGNSAQYSGGGMYNDYYSSPAVTNCTFADNSAGSGGGMYNSGDPTVTNCTFTGNTALSDTDGGGGILNWGGSPKKVTNCNFSGNTAPTGGGIYNMYSSLTVTNCAFTANSAQYYGGGMYNYGYPDVTVTNCTFTGNTATTHGGGMYNENLSRPTATNCILWGDTPDEIYSNDCVATVSYSDVQGGWSGTGNIDADPCFVDTTNPERSLWNLRLGLGSPCTDAGDNNSVPADTADLDGDDNTVEPTPFDLNGFPRFIDDLCTGDTGNGTPPIVDMGAYEFLRSDIDSSGGVNFKDHCPVAEYWLQTGCGLCGGADVTCDGDVDWNDLRELCAWWLAGK